MSRTRLATLLVGLAALAAACGSDEAADVTTGDLGALPAVTSEAPPAGSDQPVTTAPPGRTSTTAPARTTTTLPAPVSERGPRTTAAATDEDPVPVGEVLEFTGIWDIVVTEVNLDAAEEVLSFADINPAPETGFQYVMVTVEGTYLGERVAQPVFEWAVSDGANEFTPSIPGCGVIPDSIYDVVEVAPGDSFLARLCVPVAAESVEAGLELFLQPVGDEPKYFELN